MARPTESLRVPSKAKISPRQSQPSVRKLADRLIPASSISKTLLFQRVGARSPLTIPDSSGRTAVVEPGSDGGTGVAGS